MNKIYGKGGVQVVITQDHFDQVGRKIRASIPAGLEFGGFAIEAQAKKTARVDTGRYRSSIGHSVIMLSKKGLKEGVSINPADAIWNVTQGIFGAWLYIGTNVKYAADLEARHGTLNKALVMMEPLVWQGLKKAIEGGTTIL